MAMPLRQNLRIGAYVMNQKLHRREKYALVLELEPLYQCNLACAGCGKIQQPDDILARRLSVQECIDAVEDCGAPVVSIAGGEPLVHREIDQIVAALVERKKFVFLCTNALLMEKKLDKFKPSPYFSWMVHIDGLRERHDESVCRDGVFDKAVAAIREAKKRGFRVSTNTTFFGQDDASTVRNVLDYLNDDLKVDIMQISPASRTSAPRPGALPRRGAHPRHLPRGLRRRQAQEVAAQPLTAVPRLPRGHRRFPVHRLGDPVVLGAGLAAAVLPDERRYVRSYRGPAGDHRVVAVRSRQGPTLRELHGPLRLRAHRGDRHHEVARASRCAPPGRRWWVQRTR